MRYAAMSFFRRAAVEAAVDPGSVPARELAPRLARSICRAMKNKFAGAAGALMRLARVILTVLLAFAGSSGASAQSLERIFQDIGHLGQPRRAAIRAEWEKISPGEILCVDNRLRRARRSVNTLIDRGIGPTDNRVTGIVSDCRAGGDPDSSNVRQRRASIAVSRPSRTKWRSAPLLNSLVSIALSSKATSGCFAPMVAARRKAWLSHYCAAVTPAGPTSTVSSACN